MEAQDSGSADRESRSASSLELGEPSEGTPPNGTYAYAAPAKQHEQCSVDDDLDADEFVRHTQFATALIDSGCRVAKYSDKKGEWAVW